MIQVDEDQVTLADAYSDIQEQVRTFLVGNQLIVALFSLPEYKLKRKFECSS
ncbi:hypothetical protein [Methanosphaerula subterraneus]|uniref:hypothetical protein n=1 Tax=Methanosphaerula subterraneus TaxID=3350244 RepID=UPI003F82870B